MTLISPSLSTRSLNCPCPTRVYYQPLAKAIHLAWSIKSIQDNSESVFRIGPWMLDKGSLSAGSACSFPGCYKDPLQQKSNCRQRNTRSLPETQTEPHATWEHWTSASTSVLSSLLHRMGPGGKGICLIQPSMCSPNTQVSETHNWAQPWRRLWNGSMMYNYFKHWSQQCREGKSPSSIICSRLQSY